jgi:prepilin-type processing-associated H-X9-DG protein
MRAERPHGGFAVLDLLVAMMLIILLAASTLFCADNAQDHANRVRCASNLRQIGQAMLLYANENRGAYPRTNYDPATADKPTAFTKPEKAEPTDDEKQANMDPAYFKAGPKPNDVTAAYFRLLATEEITAKIFVCPTAEANQQAQDGATLDFPTVEKNVNWPDLTHLSYSFCNPYPSEAALAAGFKLNVEAPAEFALVSDLNPGVDELLKTTATSDADALKKVNSPNHEQAGQNVLYADGHVEFQQTPFCGILRDNIFTYGKSGETSGGDGIVGSPSSDTDSILLPTARTAKQK